MSPFLVRAITALLLTASGIAHADALDLRVRPTLPDEVRTIQQAIHYYLEPAGYSFASTDPAHGDFSGLVTRPVSRTAPDNQPLPIRDAILAILPDSIVLYVDPDAKRVALGRRPANVQSSADRVHVMRPAAVPSMLVEPPQVESTDIAGFTDVDDSTDSAIDDSPSQQAPTEEAETAPMAVPADATLVEPPPATFTLHLIPGETLSSQLARATPAGYQVVWRAPNDLMIAANADITGASFEDAVVQALRALWHTKNALLVQHYSNNVLVITAP